MFSTFTNPKRIGLQALIGSVLISAGFAIFSLLRGEFGETDGQILLTDLSVAGASTLILANGIVLEQGRSRVLGSLAILVSIFGFAMVIIAIWKGFDADEQAKAAVSVTFVGIALTHWSLVSIARVPKKFRLLQLAAYPLSGLLTGFLIAAMWEQIDGAGVVQVAGVIGILTVAISVILPVLQRLSRDGASGRRRIRYCPYCGKPLSAKRGGVTCPSCRAAFRVQPA